LSCGETQSRKRVLRWAQEGESAKRKSDAGGVEAAKVFAKRSALFIQKHYNEMFPLISLVEDRTAV
jgi:hypothetical protein